MAGGSLSARIPGLPVQEPTPQPAIERLMAQSSSARKGISLRGAPLGTYAAAGN